MKNEREHLDDNFSCVCSVCDCSDTGRPVELILISTVICRLMATVAKTELETVLSGFFSSVV